MNVEDSTSLGTVEIPDHLLPALTAAAELRLETACDGGWDAEQRARVVSAVRALDAVAAEMCTRAQVADLAARAAAMQGERMLSEAEMDSVTLPVTINEAWPATIEAADVLSERARLTRDLIELRDAAGKLPTSDAGAHDTDPSGCEIVEMLDVVPGAHERAQLGRRQATAGKTESVDDL